MDFKSKFTVQPLKLPRIPITTNHILITLINMNNNCTCRLLSPNDLHTTQCCSEHQLNKQLMTFSLSNLQCGTLYLLSHEIPQAYCNTLSIKGLRSLMSCLTYDFHGCLPLLVMLFFKDTKKMSITFLLRTRTI